MGCDIHMRAGIRKDGKWTAVGPVFKNRWFGKFDDEPEFTACPYSVRSYDTFAILANVRNGTGFAGVVTGSGFKYISEPRDLPDDIADHGQAEDRYMFGDHSFTWVTLAELEAFDWNQTTEHCGWVNGPQRKKMIEEGLSAPESCCGGVSGGRIKHVGLSVLDQNLDNPDMYAEVVWTEPYRTSAGTFYSETIPTLRALAKENNLPLEDVRLVFGFDS